MVLIQNGKTINEPIEVQYKKTCERCKKIGKVSLNNSPKPAMMNRNLRRETQEGMNIILWGI